MTQAEWLRVKEIAAEALVRPDDERAWYVAARCGADAALALEIRSLLEAMVQVGDRFETPALAMPTSHRVALEALQARPCSNRERRSAVGPCCGYWATGGWEPSTLPSALATRSASGRRSRSFARRADDVLLRRFQDERRILATLDHPHIARLIDGRREHRGLPYVVMEYVDGQPIDVYCTASGSTSGSGSRCSGSPASPCITRISIS